MFVLFYCSTKKGSTLYVASPQEDVRLFILFFIIIFEFSLLKIT